MYLISLYFDEKTEKHIYGFMKQVAKKTGNTYMLDGNVPPHITIAAFETKHLEDVVSKMDTFVADMNKGEIIWASVAAFLPSVIYLAPVLNEYLHEMSVKIFESIKEVEDIRIRSNYRPFQWMPHTTVGKKLSKEEVRIAFEELQNTFGMFKGNVVKIGIAKTNPYEDIKIWNLMEEEL